MWYNLNIIKFLSVFAGQITGMFFERIIKTSYGCISNQRGNSSNWHFFVLQIFAGFFYAFCSNNIIKGERIHFPNYSGSLSFGEVKFIGKVLHGNIGVIIFTDKVFDFPVTAYIGIWYHFIGCNKWKHIFFLEYCTNELMKIAGNHKYISILNRCQNFSGNFNKIFWIWNIYIRGIKNLFN